MLRYASIFLVIAVVSFIIGFLASMLAGGAVWFAKVIFYISSILFIICFVMDMLQRNKK